MLWSILIAGIPERYHTVQPLLYSLLEKQSVARMKDVELLYLLDNRRRSVGAKRNDLLRAARGEYLSFIDDDDSVAGDYIRKIHDAIVEVRKHDEPADVICFPQRAVLVQQKVVHECTYSLAHWRDREPDKRRVLTPSGTDGVLNWTGPPAHTMVWRKAGISTGPLGSDAGPHDYPSQFPEKNFGEDVDWVDKACATAKTEMQLTGPPLYFYRYNNETSRTRGK